MIVKANAVIVNVAAVTMASIIFIRALCVVYGTSPRKHKTPWWFLGFGYSYVCLGAGALFSAVEVCVGADLGIMPLMLLLGGSTGLIVFDRRAIRCWTVSDCPIKHPSDKL